MIRATRVVSAAEMDEHLRSWIEALPESPEWHSAERVVEGRLGYESGDLLIGERRFGYLMVLRYARDRGWRIQSLSLP